MGIVKIFVFELELIIMNSGVVLWYEKKNKLVFVYLKIINWYKWYNNFIIINYFVLFYKIMKFIFIYLIILKYMKFKNVKL